jgi:hypothetical protein
MYRPIDTSDPRAVAQEVQSAYLAMFPGGDLLFVPRAFGWALDCFAGQYADYQPIDARYHDLRHTLEVTLCMVRLLQSRHRVGVTPKLTQSLFEIGLLAILLHDTGYLKKRDDTEGTGAKYTLIHVDRSADFAARLLIEKGYPPEAGKAVKNMIHCTGVNVNLSAIPFANEVEQLVGFALGTGDLLGQMAADDYVDKLPELYLEFEESTHFSPGKMSNVGMFSCAEDLLRKTPSFWEFFVKPKLQDDFKGVFRFLNDPYPSGPNFYMDRIEANVARLREQFPPPGNVLAGTGH